MKSLFKQLSSQSIQRTIVFMGMLLVLFFVMYFVKIYGNIENMSGMTLGTTPPFIPPPPPPPVVDVVSATPPVVVSATPSVVASPTPSPVASPTPSAVPSSTPSAVVSATPSASSPGISGSTVQVIQVVA